MLHNHRGCLGVQVHLKIFCPPPCCPLASLWHSWLLHPTNTHVHCGRLPQCGNRHGLRARCRRSGEVQTRCAKDRPGNFRRLRHTPDFQGLADGGLATSGDAGTLQISRGSPTGAWQLQATQAHYNSRGSPTGAWQLQATQAHSNSRGSPTGCKNHISLLSKKNKNKCIWCKHAKMHHKNPKRKIITNFWSFWMEILLINVRSLYSFSIFLRSWVLIWFLTFNLSSSKLQCCYRNFSISNSDRLQLYYLFPI